MSHATTSGATVLPFAPRRPGTGSWLRITMTRAVAQFARWRREQREALELASLGDQMLRDIGLTPYDVRHAARYGRPERERSPLP